MFSDKKYYRFCSRFFRLYVHLSLDTSQTSTYYFQGRPFVSKFALSKFLLSWSKMDPTQRTQLATKAALMMKTMGLSTWWNTWLYSFQKIPFDIKMAHLYYEHFTLLESIILLPTRWREDLWHTVTSSIMIAHGMMISSRPYWKWKQPKIMSSPVVENARRFQWISKLWCIITFEWFENWNYELKFWWKNESTTSSCPRILTSFILMEFRRFPWSWFILLMWCSVRYSLRFP